MKKIIFTFCVVLLLSCNKKEEIKIEKTTNSNSEQTIADNFENDKKSLFDILSKFEDASQFFTISNSKNSEVKGKKGTIIHVVPSNLELENGNKITGEIKVELKELTNQKDLLRNNAQTVSDGKLLISGGSYYIDITSDGNKINLKKGKTLEVEFPKITNRNMELFYGERDSSNQMNWKTANKKFSTQISKEKAVVDAQRNTAPIITDDLDDLLAYTENGEDEVTQKEVKKIYETNDKIYESLKLSKLGWINCDAFYNQTTENFKVIYNSENDLTFTNSFIIFKNFNSIMNLYAEKRTMLSNDIKLPINLKVKIISFSYKNDKFYAGEKEVTISKNSSAEINLKEISEKDLEQLFKM
jgi:hypothetical protein